MGLDLVEIVMRCEEVFAIEIPDDMAETVQTVGGLYGVICRRLGLVALEPPKMGIGISRLPPSSIPPLTPWTSEDVWATVVALVVDQLQIRENEVTYTARFQQDLGCD